uniref:hypothetical protein n=1 Tax=Olsenella timonensis TaxID=1805478 RepID=UPI00094E579E|nr:hypothetical protein [Olsenella timonensis]
MSPNQKRFKIVSLIILLAALVQVVGGVLLLLGSPLAAAWRVGLGEGLVGGDAVASEVLGVLALVVGLYCLVVGVTGARAANSPRSTGKFNVLAVVMLVASLFQVGLGVVSGNVGWLAVLLAALAVLGLVFAARARAEAVDR